MSYDQLHLPSLLLFPSSANSKPMDIVGMLGWMPISRGAVDFAEGLLDGIASHFSKATTATRVTEMVFGSNGFVVGMDGASAASRSLEGPALFRLSIRAPLTSVDFAALVGAVPRVEAYLRLRDLILVCFALCDIDPRRVKNKKALQAADKFRTQIAQALADALRDFANAKKEV